MFDITDHYPHSDLRTRARVFESLRAFASVTVNVIWLLAKPQILLRWSSELGLVSVQPD